jgi:hypothetical protein
MTVQYISNDTLYSQMFITNCVEIHPTYVYTLSILFIVTSYHKCLNILTLKHTYIEYFLLVNYASEY